MTKRKGRGRNVPVTARSYTYEGRNNRKREKKKLTGKALLQSAQSVQNDT
jgi:hypothetical protein